MSITVTTSVPAQLGIKESLVPVERESLFLRVFEGDETVVIDGQSLGNSAIKTLRVCRGGQIFILPKEMNLFTKGNDWLHIAIPQDKSDRSDRKFGRFSPMELLHGFWAGCFVSDLGTKNKGELIIGPNDYEIRIEWI